MLSPFVLDFFNLLGESPTAASEVDMPKLKEPGFPKLILRDRLFDLLCATEPLLDVVDCDQRLRLPTPSFRPPMLLDRRCEALGRRRDSGDVDTGFEKFAGLLETFVLACGAAGSRDNDRPGPIELLLSTLPFEDEL
jgi:hypothetical protein